MFDFNVSHSLMYNSKLLANDFFSLFLVHSHRNVDLSHVENVFHISFVVVIIRMPSSVCQGKKYREKICVERDGMKTEMTVM